MVDALAVQAEEGRLYKDDIIDKLFNKRYQSVVSEWGNPGRGNTAEPRYARNF